MTGGAAVSRNARIPTRARFAMASSQFANKRGVYLGRRSTKIHVALYRRSNGKIGGHLPGWPAARILLLDHVGARTGLKRTSPLMYHEEDDVVAVVASKAAQPTHPAWYHNLRANPAPRFRSVRRSATSVPASQPTRSAIDFGRSSWPSTRDTSSSVQTHRIGRSRS
jgi:deazaflavin-dependent oxidoreductase (nitroreductase family)